MANDTSATRRDLLIGAGCVGLVTILPREGRATPETMTQRWRSGIPTDNAAWWSSATALSARPMRVR